MFNSLFCPSALDERVEPRSRTKKLDATKFCDFFLALQCLGYSISDNEAKRNCWFSLT